MSVSRGRSTSNFASIRKRVTSVATQPAFVVQTTDSGSNAGNGGNNGQASCFHANIVNCSARLCGSGSPANEEARRCQRMECGSPLDSACQEDHAVICPFGVYGHGFSEL